MQIRPATLQDIPQLKSLYQGTITHINRAHYNPEQIRAWAATGERITSLENKIKSQHFYAAVTTDEQITGFASLEDDGELDMMYVHKDYQRQGIAAMLIKQLYKKAAELGLKTLVAYVSITARPFFEKQGFKAVETQQVQLGEVMLENYKMVKDI
ncbi:GNAT family N-acetyltransferase [Chitinophaga sp. 22321]|uniref:GNAT family N-acetyltransferase n=1 Tax=Chitinophaga hostae TaxID=2831022 RepID=A0ABS5J187_9BACT|nr:GNAT family N-acetyltransferase [Chitinophaga hostae]MBS0028905.1 GNAT family N-acetyltransferase [Chitinophaga hostae]